MIEMLLFGGSMLVVGWIVFRVVSQREEGDTALHEKLDADDHRAAIGRGERPPE